MSCPHNHCFNPCTCTTSTTFHHHPNPCSHPCSNPCTNSPINHQQQQQLLQALTTILFQSPSPPPSPPITTLYSSSQYLHQHQQHQQHEKQEQNAIHSLLQRIVALESTIPYSSPYLHPHQHNQQQQDDDAIHSLLQRIAALESSQHPHRHSSAPPPKQRHHCQQPRSTVKATPLASSKAISLRDFAARTIQAAFRRFLVQRSRTLRHLKDLAAIQSRLAALKPALSSGMDRGHDLRAISQAANDLLIQLESIQSGDPMIREGKRSIGRELFRIMDFVDKFMVKDRYEEKHQDSNEGNRSIVRDRAKRVSFSDNSKGLRNDLFNEGYCDASGEHNGYVDSLGEGLAGIHVRDHLVELQHISDDDRSSDSSTVENGIRYVSGGHLKMHSTKRGLSAPMPAQMEPRKN